MVDTTRTSQPGRTILVWHVHGAWTSAFVRGGHTYLLPRTRDGGPDGLGRAGRDWPANAVEIHPDRLRETNVDLVVLQRPRELELVTEWLGRRPGDDVPAVYVEHNTPHEHAATTRHPLADRADIPLVHVTTFNEAMWDNGIARTHVIPHGIPDPGHRYTGELDRAAVLINDPVRRWRVTGTDLLPEFARVAELDVYGIGTDKLTGAFGDPAIRPGGDLPSEELFEAMARRRVYVHTARWTSLGLSLLEAMHLGMPVVAFAGTEVPVAVPAEAGVVSSDVTELVEAVRRLCRDPSAAREMGAAARGHALENFGLDTFLEHWDALVTRLVG